MRKIPDAAMLLMCAILGMALGFTCIVPEAYSGRAGGLFDLQVLGLAGGAVLGSATWLVYRYSKLPP